MFFKDIDTISDYPFPSINLLIGPFLDMSVHLNRTNSLFVHLSNSTVRRPIHLDVSVKSLMPNEKRLQRKERLTHLRKTHVACHYLFKIRYVINAVITSLFLLHAWQMF